MRDTGTAAVGWQRALRLEPLSADMRDRLDATPGFRDGFLGDVPPVPVSVAESLGAFAWLAGWGLLAVAVRRRRRGWRRIAVATLALAAAIGLGTILLGEIVSGRRHVIVVSPDQLRVAPALASEFAGEVVTGEAAMTTGAQSVWTRVRFSDGRSGWLESRHLASLDIDHAP
jgi:hypothetical protein